MKVVTSLTDLINICQPTVFTLEQVNKLVPLLSRITEKHNAAVEHALGLERFFIKSGAHEDRVKECDIEVGKNLVEWGRKMVKLGGKVLPGGFVGFDSGSFLWSWHYGERSVEYYHEYFESPSSRRKYFPQLPIGDTDGTPIE